MSSAGKPFRQSAGQGWGGACRTGGLDNTQAGILLHHSGPAGSWSAAAAACTARPLHHRPQLMCGGQRPWPWLRLRRGPGDHTCWHARAPAAAHMGCRACLPPCSLLRSHHPVACRTRTARCRRPQAGAGRPSTLQRAPRRRRKPGPAKLQCVWATPRLRALLRRPGCARPCLAAGSWAALPAPVLARQQAP